MYHRNPNFKNKKKSCKDEGFYKKYIWRSRFDPLEIEKYGPDMPLSSNLLEDYGLLYGNNCIETRARYRVRGEPHFDGEYTLSPV